PHLPVLREQAGARAGRHRGRARRDAAPAGRGARAGAGPGAPDRRGLRRLLHRDPGAPPGRDAHVSRGEHPGRGGPRRRQGPRDPDRRAPAQRRRRRRRAGSAAPDRCRDLQLRPADGRPFVGAEALVLRPADDLRGVPARPDRTAAVHRDPARAPRPLHRPARRPRLDPPRGAADAAVEQGLLRPIYAGIFSYDLLTVAHSWALKHWYFAPRMTFEEFLRGQTALLLSTAILPEHRDRYTDLLGDLV